MKELTSTDIKIMLLKKGLKQKDIADALGVTESYVSQIIKGKRIAKKYLPKLLELIQEELMATDEPKVEDEVSSVFKILKF